MDPIDFANTIFTQSVKPPKTFEIECEDMDIVDLFEYLLVVMTNGLKIKYGNGEGKVDLTNLSDENLKLVNDYFHSFGFECMYVVYPIEAEHTINFEDISYQNIELSDNTKLTDMCCPIKVKDKIYAIGFNYYK
jgi:hypothetical protein